MAVNSALRQSRKPAVSRFKIDPEERQSYPGTIARAFKGSLALGFLTATVSLLTLVCLARASTYVVYVALDDPAYEELDKLNGMGLLDDYLSGVRPIARVEAARLTLEAEQNLDDAEQDNLLSRTLINSLRDEFSEEIEWLENNHEDNPPTMVHPLDRVEAQYIYSSGTQRIFHLYIENVQQFQAREVTPLLPNNDGLPTAQGSNEVARGSSWAGLGGFLTAYGETAIAGPIGESPETFMQGWEAGSLYRGSPAITETQTTNRARLMRGGVVVSLGNQALAYGYQEMAWGTGYFNSLAMGDNARAFPALIFENIHPSLLPGIFRYLGPFRHQVFIGQLNHGRYAEVPPGPTTPSQIENFNYPWISGQVIEFKPLPTFEFGLDHTIVFGGSKNNNYSWQGFVGRATGVDTGSPCTFVGPVNNQRCVPGTSANTKSRGGIFLKIYVPSLRNAQVYQEILGSDNLSTEFRPIGGILPFLSVSYQGGVYIPRVSADGKTEARFEYAIIEPNYSTHVDSLYFANYGQLMGDPMGPDSSEVDLSVARWFNYRYRGDIDLFYTERAPAFQIAGLSKERSGGFALDLLELPDEFTLRNITGLGSLKLRVALEDVHDINWMRGDNSLRTLVLISGALWPNRASWIWH